MSDYFVEQLAAVRRELADLKRDRVTYRQATVTTADAGTATFAATVAGADRDLAGIAAPPQFLPEAGQQVRLTLAGATPLYEPAGIAANAVGTRELAPEVNQQITVALDAANGKNKVTFSVDAPSGSGGVAGDVWFRRALGTGVVSGSWEWDGDSWEPRTFGDEVLNSLTVGKLVGGTITANWIVAGSIATATSGRRAGIDALGLFATDDSGNTTVRLGGVNNLIMGTVSTGVLGIRHVKIGATGATGRIDFVAPDGGTGTVQVFNSDVDGYGIENLHMGFPQSGVHSAWNAVQITDDERIFASSRYMRISVGGETGIPTTGFAVDWANNKGGPSTPWTSSSRFAVTRDRTEFWIPPSTTGDIVMWERVTGFASPFARLWVRPHSISNWFREGGAFEVSERSDDYLATSVRYQALGDGMHRFWSEAAPGVGGQTYIEIKKPAQGNHSPTMALMTEDGFGGALSYAGSATGGEQMEVLNWGATAFIQIGASAFNVSSDAAGKTDIADADLDFMGEIRGHGRVRSYRRKDAGKRRRERVVNERDANGELLDVSSTVTVEDVPARLEIGLVAQEAPPIMVTESSRGLMIDLYQAWALHHGALQQVGGTLDAVLARLDKLEKGRPA